MAHPKMPKRRYADEDFEVRHGYRKVGDLRMNRAKMLALVLYTGCDCNYAMCAAERSGDYATWRWFSHLLFEALFALPREGGVVYSSE